MILPGRALWVGCVLLALAGDVAGSGSKLRDPVIAVRFHAQVYAFDPTFTAKVKVGNPPKEIVIEKLPSLTERDIDSFYPYRAADGSYSVVFDLDRHGAVLLENISAQKRGQSLVVAINGKPVCSLLVDKTISDGIIFVPYGLTEADIRALGQSFDIMGQTAEDKKAHRVPPPPFDALKDDATPVATPKPGHT